MIAGCNGSGKSSYSKALVANGVIPFDYDKYFLEFYNSLQQSDFQEEMAHNLAFMKMEDQIDFSLNTKSDFSYETNFNSTPLFWPKKFKKNGFEIHLIYLLLDSVDEAKRRVAVRVQNGGHFVPENEIRKRYFQGFENFNKCFRFFDYVDVFDCSRYEKAPKFCFSIKRGNVLLIENLPDFIESLVPDIYKLFSPH